MNRREGIIVGMTVLAALYGLIDYGLRPYFQPPEEDGGAARLDTTLLSTMAAGALGGNRHVERLTAILQGDRRPWPPDLFLTGDWNPERADQGRGTQGGLQPLAGDYVYSGYLRMGEEKIAIINGIDYKQGELVDGYRLEAIETGRVLLSRDHVRYELRMEEEKGEGREKEETP